MDHKKRVENAVEGYYKRQEAKDAPPTRTNEKPEKELEKLVLIWLKQNGFDVDCIESKSKFNTETMRYSGRAASSGTADICGNFRNGLAVYVELKAAGRRSTLRDQQRKFLTRKIQSNCFAVCIDRVTELERCWTHFKSLPLHDRIEFLLKELPKQKSVEEQGSLFD